MKAIFLITNHYIDADPFQRIVDSLKKRGVVSTICWYSMNAPPVDAILYNCGRVPLKGDGIIRCGVGQRVRQIFNFISDKYVVEHFLSVERPDVFLMGGDITDHYGRLFLDTCRKLKIRVVLIPIAIPGPSMVNPNPDKGIPMAWFARLLLRFFGLEETIFFRGWVLGRYFKEAEILVPYSSVKTMLTQNGIEDGRIFVVGNLSEDRIYERKTVSKDLVRAAFFKSLQLDASHRLVVFCSTGIDSIAGFDYLEKLVHSLHGACNKLPANCRIIVKLHPRECDQAKILYANTFKEDRYMIVDNTDLYNLLISADLVMCNEVSNVLFDAVMLETPVLSIKSEEDKGFCRFGEISEYVHIMSEDQMYPKIWKMLFDEHFQVGNKEFIGNWIRQAGNKVDGKSVERAAEVIIGQLLRQKL